MREGSNESTERGGIVVLGSANMDLVVRQARAARPGETLFGESFTTGPGGKGLNQAVAAARAGARVEFIGVVGSDDFGARLRRVLENEHIDVAGLRSAAESTGVAAISVVDDGENSIVVVPGANSLPLFDEADRARVRRASYLVAQLERPLSLIAEALRYAHQQGVITVLTPAPVQAGASDLVDLVDVLILNDGEARALAGAVDAEEAALLLSARAGTVIVTLGARGAIAAAGNEIVTRVSAHPVKAMDTTGAGDTFVGVLVAGLDEGLSLDRALERASLAASLAVTRAGAASSMPRHQEILDAEAAHRIR